MATTRHHHLLRISVQLYFSNTTFSEEYSGPFLALEVVLCVYCSLLSVRVSTSLDGLAMRVLRTNPLVDYILPSKSNSGSTLPSGFAH